MQHRLHRLIDDISFIVESATRMQSHLATMVGRGEVQEPVVNRFRQQLEETRDLLDTLESDIEEMEQSIDSSERSDNLFDDDTERTEHTE